MSHNTEQTTMPAIIHTCTHDQQS